MIDRLHPKQENTQKTQTETADRPRRHGQTTRNILLYVITVYKTLRVAIQTNLALWRYV